MALSDGMEALARTVARSRARDETPRLMWGQVADAGPPAQVVLDGDQSSESRPVSGSAVGPVAAGQRVLLARQGRRLWIVNAPAPRPRVAAGFVTLPTGGDWDVVPLPPGVFAAPPVVTATVADGTGEASGVTVRIGSTVTTSEFRIHARKRADQPNELVAVRIGWIAVQP